MLLITLRIKFENWLFKKLCCFTPEQVGLLAAFYEKTTGKNPEEITDEEC